MCLDNQNRTNMSSEVYAPDIIKFLIIGNHDYAALCNEDCPDLPNVIGNIDNVKKGIKGLFNA